MTMRKVMRKEPVAALFFGGLVGAGVALATAPKSGRELRHSIGRFAGDAGDRVRDYAEAGKAKVVDLTDRGGRYVSGRKALFSKSFAAGRETYRKEKGKVAGKG